MPAVKENGQISPDGIFAGPLFDTVSLSQPITGPYMISRLPMLDYSLLEGVFRSIDIIGIRIMVVNNL